jgi:hypothetical protein
MPRAAIGVLALCAVLACAGCYGSTEPASNIGLTGATLNGAGTTNNGPADVFFQFWPSAYPNRVRETLHVTIPGGATGPVSRFTGRGLALDTPYSFRLCGADSGQQPVCAQTRTFRMPKPDGDAVVGEVPQAYGFRSLVIEAQSSPTGGSPTGSLSVTGAFGGTVDSVQVTGNRAAVHAIGQAYQGTNTSNAVACASIGDGGPDVPPGSGDFVGVDIAITEFGQTLGACVPPAGGFDGAQDGVAVYDAPGSSSSIRTR